MQWQECRAREQQEEFRSREPFAVDLFCYEFPESFLDSVWSKTECVDLCIGSIDL